MVQVSTNLTTRESARRERFEPTGTIAATNVQKAIEEVAAESGGGTITQTVTVAAYVAQPTDDEIWVNRAGAVTITLPDAAAWLAAHGNGKALTIKDISGAASANNITINRAGANTIDGANSVTITSDYGSWKLRPTSAGIWGLFP